MKQNKKIFQVTYNNFDISTFNKDILIIVPAVFVNYKDICKNYFLSLRRIKLNKQVLFCTNDSKLVDFFNNEKIPYAFFQLNTSNYKTRLEWLEVERFLKTYMLRYIINNIKCDFISSDADIYLHKNPLPYLKKLMEDEKLDLITISDKRYKNIINFKLQKSNNFTDQDKYGTLNAAFCLWKNNKVFKNSFDKVLKILDKYPKLTEAGATQTIFNEHLLKLVKANKVRIKELHPHLFVNGFTLKNTDKKYLKNRYLTHFNFESRDLYNIDNEIKDKIKTLKDNKLWII
jgi:hypothetical protein